MLVLANKKFHKHLIWAKLVCEIGRPIDNIYVMVYVKFSILYINYNVQWGHCKIEIGLYNMINHKI